MTKVQALPLQVRILLLRQEMALQRQLIQQQLEPKPQGADRFPRSLGMRVLHQYLSNAGPWQEHLQNTLLGKESTLLWSLALTLAQHWMQKKRKASD